MKKHIKSILAIHLALVMLLSFVACAGDNTTDAEDTQVTLPAGIVGPAVPNPPEASSTAESNDGSHDMQQGTQNGDANVIPNPIDEPLKHLIFGSGSYMDGDNMVAMLSRGQLPTDYKSPLTMYIKTYEEWQEFYGGMPRSLMNGDFVTAVSNIKQSFFDKSALLLVIVEAPSPAYTHTAEVAEYRNNTLEVTITTDVPTNAIGETSYACIMIPIERTLAESKVVVSHKKA